MTETYYKQEVEKFQFYQFPKWLWQEPYCDLSLQAKTVYTFLYDRLSLSLKNKWYDKDGKIYILFSNENLASRIGGLNCSVPTIIKAKKELANAGLLKEVRQGLNLSNRLYLLGPKVSHENLTDFNTELKNIKHRTKDFLIQDDKKFKTNKTESIKTENSNTNIDDMTEVILSFQKAFRGHTPTPFQFEDLTKFHQEDGLSVEIIIEAIKRTSNNNANYNYLQGILKNWARKGIRTMEQVLADDANFEQRKNSRSSAIVPEKSNVPEWSNQDYKNETSPEKMAELERKKSEMLKRLEK
ncbi:replication initiator protein A [Streptococcus porci]|uniref:replication initiator protein A n=1 Tax=Streptococcus porci TaxID=502567 RepID=UPI0004189720|nr:replication initiator protein A [Streptococcus porci]